MGTREAFVYTLSTLVFVISVGRTFLTTELVSLLELRRLLFTRGILLGWLINLMAHSPLQKAIDLWNRLRAVLEQQEVRVNLWQI